MKDTVGRGWVFPPRLDDHNHMALTDYDSEIKQSIFVILNTAPGERVMRPDFGCRIHEAIFAPANHATAAMVETYVKEALGRWEPRINLRRVLVTPSPEHSGALLIEIEYQIKDRPDVRSLVYPFYLNPS